MTGRPPRPGRTSRQLGQAGASRADVVAVRQWLTDAAGIRAYADVRSTFITHEPAFMLGVIPGLVRPGFLVEIEVIAAVPARQAP